MSALSLSAILGELPPAPIAPPSPATTKIVVLDDDPTGTQTVHGTPVLTTWDVPALEAALREPGACFYILTNTRAFPSEVACRINREIGAHLARAARSTRRAFSVVSRGDSTLRGHYPAETDALTEGLGMAWDGTLLVPAFFAGGRYTIGDVHYVADGDALVPVADTEFAKDRSFGYRSSNLRQWVEEKTAGRILARDVLSISIDDLRIRGAKHVAHHLLSLPRGGVAIVNAASPGDLAVLTWALAETRAAGRRHLFRTAADFVASYAGIPKRPLLTAGELATAGCKTGGLLVAGSYMGKTSAQLEALFKRCPGVERIEVAVDHLLHERRRESETARCVAAVDRALASGRGAVLFTSRRLVAGRDTAGNLAIGTTVSSSLAGIVRALRCRPRWLIAKGGITSSDLATSALGIRRAIVLGQALPGVPVWLPGSESKWPGLPLIVFPGNVGGLESIANLVETLE